MITTAPLTPLYKVEFKEVKNSHIYTIEIDGEKVELDSVTKVLGIIAKPALVGWAKRTTAEAVGAAFKDKFNGQESVTIDRQWIDALLKEAVKRPDALRDKAADDGTQIHAIIDGIIKGTVSTAIPEQYVPVVEAFKRWWEPMDMQFILGDTPVASKKYGYGGKLDGVCRKRLSLILLDWKTGKGIYPEAAMQGAAYAQGFEETYGEQIERIFIVRFGKTAPIEFEKLEVADIKKSFQAFLSALHLHNRLKVNQYIGW